MECLYMEVNVEVCGKTRVICLIGNPVEHSISPQLHNTISKYLCADLIYIPFKVEKNDLENAVNGLRALNIKGFNVTIPYKSEVIKYLDEVNEEARMIGAVNTVKNESGKLIGFNTDMDGFYRSFKEESGTAGFAGKRVLLIGAGGAARAIALGAAKDGASEICIVNRTVEKALDLMKLIDVHFGIACRGHAFERLAEEDIVGRSDIIINTTSIGMHPYLDESPLSDSPKFVQGQIVYDVIYNPLKTKLIKQAEEAGIRAINGLGMLLYQGIFAYKIWTGKKVHEDIIKKLYAHYSLGE